MTFDPAEETRLCEALDNARNHYFETLDAFNASQDIKRSVAYLEAKAHVDKASANYDAARNALYSYWQQAGAPGPDCE